MPGVSVIPASARTKLVAILGRLGSDHAGERDAAALAAMRLLSQHKVGWPELLAEPRPHREPLHGTWRVTCAELAKRPAALRPWEREFIADLPRFRRISTKQRYVLNEIATRVLGAAHG
jgi:hypothetical protein